MWPKVSANGKKVVFRKDYQLFVYDVDRKSSKKLKINVYNNTTLDKNQSFNVKGNITYFDVSPDGKKMAFVSRGRMFVSDIKGKFVKEIKANAKEAIQEVKWLKDNSSLLFSQSTKGYYNWFVTNVKSTSKPKQLTKNIQNNRQITFNKDLTKGVYLSGRNEIYTMDLKTYKTELIVKDELWGFYNANPYFSPDDAYVLFNAYRDFEADVFAYNLSTKRKINLTNTKVSEFGPVWSADGKHIYFSSERISPNFPSGGNGNSKVYQMALDKYEKPFLHQLISSQLDMDRLDYLKRDSFFTGVSEGSIGSERIINMLDVRDDEIIVEEKGIYSIENFLSARRLMYWQVYLHKTSVSAEEMLIQIIRRAKYLTQKGKTVEATPALKYFLERNIGKKAFEEDPDIIDLFSLLDDSDIWGSMKFWRESDDYVLSTLSKNLLERKLFKIYMDNDKPDSTLVESTKSVIKDLTQVSNHGLSFLSKSGKISNSAYIHSDKKIKILTKRGEILGIEKAADLPNIKAMSKIVTKHYYCWLDRIHL